MLRDSLPYRFGLNYTPLKSWYYCWNEWDLDALGADLDAVAALGVDHLRLQIIWPYFQPNPTYVSKTHLSRLRQFMHMAADRGLDVLPALLTGFLSGYFLLPPNVAAMDVFRDADVFASIQLYFRAVIESIVDCPNLMGIDLGNEVNCLDHTLPCQVGDAWARRLQQTVAEVAGELVVVNGIDHTPLFAGTTFSMPHLSNDYDMISLHTWPFFTGCLEYGELDGPASVNLASFATLWARMYAERPNAPVWIQEFGCCDLWGTSTQQETYLRQTITSAASHGVRHFTFWCSHDKTCDIRFEQFEYHYGLIDTDNRTKPLGHVYRELIRQVQTGDDASGNPKPAEYDCTLVVADDFVPRFRKAHPPATWVAQQASSTLWDVYHAHLKLIDQGRTPTLQLASRADRRSIGEIIRASTGG